MFAVRLGFSRALCFKPVINVLLSIARTLLINVCRMKLRDLACSGTIGLCYRVVLLSSTLSVLVLLYLRLLLL